MVDETTTLNEETEVVQGQVTEDISELEKKYKALQSDYTKKAQELAELKKQPQSQEEETNDEAVAEQFVAKVLEKYWLKDLPETIKQKQNDESFERLADYEPSLKAQESAIKKIAQVEWLSIEDVIKNYNFLSSDKLEKAKESRQIVGRMWIEEKKEKSINDMTPAEWEAYKAKLSGR